MSYVGQPPSAVLGSQGQGFAFVVTLPTLRVGRTAEGGCPHMMVRCVLGTRYYRDSCGFKSQPASSTSNRSAPSGKDASLYQFFGPGGVLSRTHPAYEFRRGQLQMAQAVEQALEEKRHLIVEAGTGTGKTLAYLMPVIRSGKRVIISTGTKNLQEQLFYKDVPFLEQALYGLPASGSSAFGLLYEGAQQLFVPQETV